MSDGKVVIDSEIDDRGISRGLKDIKGKLRTLDTSLIKTAALGAAITIAPSLSPAIGTAIGAVGALSASFAAAGTGAVAFGALAITNLKGIFDAAGKAEGAYEGLNNKQIKAVETLRNFKKFWSGFAKQFEEPILDLFMDSLTSLQTIIMELRPTFEGSVKAITTLMDNFQKSLKDNQVQAFFDFLNTNAASSLTNLGTAFGNVMKGVMGLLVAFGPLSKDIESGLVKLTQRFAEWSAGLSNSKGFQKFIDYVKENGPKLLEIVGNVANIFKQLLIDLAPLGSEILSALQTFTRLIVDNWPGIRETVIGLAAAVGSYVLMMKGLQIIGVINTLMSAYRAGTLAATLAQYGLNTAMLLNPMTWVVAGIAALIAIGVLLYRNWDTVKAKAIEVWGAMKGWFSSFFETLKTLFHNALNWIDEKTNGKFSAVVVAIKGYMNMVWANIKVVWDFIKNSFRNALDFVKALVHGDFKGMWQAIKNQMGNIKGTISEIWGNVMDFLRKINLKEIGKNIIRGLINGVKSMARSLVNGVKGVVNGAIEGAKKLLGIHSPSRVFMEIGEFTGQGMEVGLGKATKGVQKAMGDMVIPEFKGIGNQSVSDAIVNLNMNSIGKSLVDSMQKLDDSNTRNTIFPSGPIHATLNIAGHAADATIEFISMKQERLKGKLRRNINGRIT